MAAASGVDFGTPGLVCNEGNRELHELPHSSWAGDIYFPIGATSAACNGQPCQDALVGCSAEQGSMRDLAMPSK